MFQLIVAAGLAIGALLNGGCGGGGPNDPGNQVGQNPVPTNGGGGTGTNGGGGTAPQPGKVVASWDPISSVGSPILANGIIVNNINGYRVYSSTSGAFSTTPDLDIASGPDNATYITNVPITTAKGVGLNVGDPVTITVTAYRIDPVATGGTTMVESAQAIPASGTAR